jgi:hypothetical protein
VCVICHMISIAQLVSKNNTVYACIKTNTDEILDDILYLTLILS